MTENAKAGADEQPSAKRVKVEEGEDVDEIQVDHGNTAKNSDSKSEVSKKLENPAAGAIAKLVSFYFSDANFRRDKFLQNEASKDKEGFVKIGVLLTFNKLKALTQNVAEVADAVDLHASADGLIGLNKTRDAIRRVSQLGPDNSSERTAFVCGFATDPIPSVDDLITLFSEGDLGEVQYVRRRMGLANPRDKQSQKRFIGSVFVEYANEASVAKLCSRCPEEGTSDEASAENKSIGDGSKNPSTEQQPKDDGISEKSSVGQQPKNDETSEKASAEQLPKVDCGDSEKSSACTETSEQPKIQPLVFQSLKLTAVPLRKWLDRERKHKQGPGTRGKENDSIKYDVGMIIKLDGVGTSVTRTFIKDTFSAYGDVKYVDLPVGGTCGFVRFDKPEHALKAVTEVDAVALEKMFNSLVKISLLEGDEEKGYWAKIAQGQRHQKTFAPRGNKRGYKRGRDS
mmetsp:Transcript_52215/g.71261  ORF Transcript_52215/g.71261 Transcript_52215/m.71261 type:complete len:456 (-) Transcript_52215:144-1511(-)|eukprot:CAMPEP_0185775872 /NCGR_PEP_ID=MMETSP1174-20130828/83627_1 /TAXON_ID=35687 /ORGANISM="Dictyocha speculum, Strain CCMP1381" /LENGTH=455 /DNA_ID=CAMNT_0028463597 /DNA_START=21 /DNA_END=1388 /DNA_ORIENTATION=+